MAHWFESGQILLAIVGVVLVEGVVLVIAARRAGKALTVTTVFFQLTAGALLLLATRSALVGEPWTVTAAFVTASLPVHLVDLAIRWRAS